MNRKEHLLLIAEEEALEVAHRLSKALRFGVDEVEPGQDLNNSERVWVEFIELSTVMNMLTEEGHFARPHPDRSSMEYVHNIEADKRARVERYLEFSRTKGTLTD